MAKKPEKNVKLSPPWDGHMSMLDSFFKGDKRIRVGYCDKNRVGTIEVLESKAYDALSQVIRDKIRFGKVTLRINVVLADGVKPEPCPMMTDLEALKYVLKCNPAFSKIRTEKGKVFNFTYCLFKPLVLQWYNDNLGNPWKLTTSTFEKEVDRVFKRGIGISFATEPPRGAKFRKADKKSTKQK